MISDLVKNIPMLNSVDPEQVFLFLVRAREVYDLKLVSDEVFLALLVARTSGRIMAVISRHLQTFSGWGMVCSDILATFLPSRIRETFLSRYILCRFQGHDEDLFHFITSVVTAASILDYGVSELELARRIIQNMHPSVRSWLTFESEPKSIEELYGLASRVAEARAVEQCRSGPERAVLGRNVSRDEQGIRPISMLTRVGSRSPKGEIRCFRCTKLGHVARDCRSSHAPVVRRQGNGEGARSVDTL